MISKTFLTVLQARFQTKLGQNRRSRLSFMYSKLNFMTPPGASQVNSKCQRSGSQKMKWSIHLKKAFLEGIRKNPRTQMQRWVRKKRWGLSRCWCNLNGSVRIQRPIWSCHLILSCCMIGGLLIKHRPCSVSNLYQPHPLLLPIPSVPRFPMHILFIMSSMTSNETLNMRNYWRLWKGSRGRWLQLPTRRSTGGSSQMCSTCLGMTSMTLSDSLIGPRGTSTPR